MYILHPDTDILTEYGYYTKVSSLKAGDRIYNSSLAVVEVKDVELVHEDIELQEINYESVYIHLYCVNDTDLLVSKNNPVNYIKNTLIDIDILEFKTAKQIEPSDNLGSSKNIYRNITDNIQLIEYGDNQVVHVNYYLGLYNGLYLGFGNITNEHIIEFKFGPKPGLCEELKNIIHILFGDHIMVDISHTDEVFYTLSLYDINVVRYTIVMGIGDMKLFPTQYMIPDDDYMKGIFDGLTHYGSLQTLIKYISVNKSVARFFNYCCGILGIRFFNKTKLLNNELTRYLLYLKDNQPDDSFIATVMSTDTYTTNEYIKLVLCEQETIIAGGIILKT